MKSNPLPMNTNYLANTTYSTHFKHRNTTRDLCLGRGRVGRIRLFSSVRYCILPGAVWCGAVHTFSHTHKNHVLKTIDRTKVDFNIVSVYLFVEQTKRTWMIIEIRHLFSKHIHLNLGTYMVFSVPVVNDGLVWWLLVPFSLPLGLVPHIVCNLRV